jgi:hypothetical protein
MTLDDRTSKMLTCAPHNGCKLEEACFTVAKYAYKQRSAERLQAAQARVAGAELPDDFPELSTWEAAR